MLKIKYISLILCLAMILSACSKFDLLNKDVPPKTEVSEGFKFSIDKIALSRSYQNTIPRVEVIKRNNRTSLLVSAGLVKSSGVEVLDVSKVDNTINIQIRNKEDKSAQLVIPQIWIDISGISQSTLETMRFNIINENYNPIEITYGIVDVLNKISSDLRISSSSSPSTELIQDGDKFIWEIYYQNIFDRYSKEIPLINLKVQVDTKSGSIISSSKSLISSLVDEGKIVDFIQDKGMLYIIENPESTYKNSLWFYDFKEKSKELYFETNDQILNVKLSPDEKNISLITSKETKNFLYIIQTKDRRVLYVNVLGDLSPRVSLWKDKDELYVLGEPTELSSTLLLYNLDDNIISQSRTYNTPLANFRYKKDLFLIAEIVQDSPNRNIKISNDDSYFRHIGSGFMVNLIDKDFVIFLSKSLESDVNILNVYNLNDPEEGYIIEKNILNYQILNKDKILLVEKLNGGNDFMTYILHVDSKELEEIGKVNSNLVYLDYNRETLYVDLIIPFESDLSEIIYTIDAKHIK